MDKQLHILKKAPLKYQQEDKITVKRKFFLGSIIATFIAGSPFLFYLYNYVPPTSEWQTPFFDYHSGFYENAQTAMWMLTGKLITLLLYGSLPAVIGGIMLYWYRLLCIYIKL